VNTFTGQLRRELQLAARARSDVLNPVIFLLLAITLFALALEGKPEVLREHAPGILWVLVLLTNMLALDGMFRRDFDDGSLEQLLLAGDAVVPALLGKLLVQWLVTGLLAVLLSPLLGMILNLPATVYPLLALVLLVATPAVSFIGAMGAALTAGARRGGALLALLVLPLLVPVLIFGVSAVNRALEGEAPRAELYWLGAISIASLMAAPFATRAGLCIALEQ
jgi:heme exporter protein B